MSEEYLRWKKWYSSWIEPWRFYARIDELLVCEELGIKQISEENAAFFDRMEELGLPLVEEKK